MPPIPSTVTGAQRVNRKKVNAELRMDTQL